jgi:hypothetical protein
MKPNKSATTRINTTTTTTTLSSMKTTKRYQSGSSSSGSGGSKESTSQKAGGWWSSAEFWGGLGAIAGWGMSGAAIYDASLQGPEVISLTMTPVLIVYSTLFARWAYVVKPRNLLLMWCHVTNVAAQSNQLRRALEYKIETGNKDQVDKFVMDSAKAGGVAAVAVAAGPKIRSVLTGTNLGIISRIAASEAGPFTVHFWYVP